MVFKVILPVFFLHYSAVIFCTYSAVIFFSLFCRDFFVVVKIQPQAPSAGTVFVPNRYHVSAARKVS